MASRLTVSCAVSMRREPSGGHAELEPGVAVRPQDEGRAQAHHMERRRHEVGQAEQVVLVAADAVHQHQQPGLRHPGRGWTMQ
jgi:hypothetical protein